MPDKKVMTWEYLVLEHQGRYWFVNRKKEEKLDGKPNHEVLNIIGRDGWELVNFLDRDRIEFYFYFKRPVQ